MPLKRGSSKKVIEANFKYEHKKHPEMSDKQIQAIVLSSAARSKKKAKK